MRRLLLAAVLACAPLTMAHAAESTYQPTISLQGGAGLSLYMPYLQAQLGWRLPVGDRRWELTASQTLWHGTWTSVQPNYSLLGARYYFRHTGSWQTFAAAAAGAGYNLPYTSSTGEAREGRLLHPVVGAGVGFDWMPWEHLGLSGQILLGFPMIIRPELNLRVAF